MAYVAVNSLVRTMELEFLQPQPRPILQEMELIPSNKHLIQSLCQKLGSLIKLFDENKMEGGAAIKHLERRLGDVAFRVEDEIEFQIAYLYETQDEFGTTQGEKSCPSFKLACIVQQAIQDIDAIQEEIMKLQIKKEYKPHGTKTAQRASHSENKMVGKDKELQIIREMLIKHSPQHLETVSIKGMGGIGKTTLATQVYKDLAVTSHFDKRAWCLASQHHNKRQMLLDLLNSMRYAEWDADADNNDLALQLHRALKGQRYLVVVDDVWSTSAWDAIKSCFPDDNNSSRVLLITRHAEVAMYANFNYDYSHQMCLLNQSESWNLLCEKAYLGSLAQLEIEMICRQIVEKCKGLPLAIVMMAGIIKSLSSRGFDDWIALNSETTTILVEECSKIFSLSYNHLPHKLKACFLFLGVFPKGKAINVKDVVRLWAVEGLIKGSENKSLDEVGERYISELLDRNLILASKRSGCGRKMMGFKMHDLVHAFCVREAQNENILHVVTENCSNFPLQGFRWLSIQSQDFDTRSLYSSSSSLKCRSIFCFTKAKSLCLKRFNLLRVFYFTDASMCKKIVDLVHLRYLPPVFRHFRTLKLFRAWNLQTLSIYADGGRNKSKFLPKQDSHSPAKLVLKPSQCTVELLRKNAHLKEVRITGERRECNDRIDNLVYLPQLEGLYINGNVWDYRTPKMIQINHQIARLKSLKTLSFRSMNFEWKGINVLCQLPMLEVLKLFSSGIGKEWELTEEDVFSQLFVLEIVSTDLRHWEANFDNFPKLERLLLRDCFKLREIPTKFADIYILASIKLTRCHPSAVTSAKQIQEEQLDYGNSSMTVIEEDTIIQSQELESDEHESD